jgi:multisubunit Na+/H+ antiporter MnhB subunit
MNIRFSPLLATGVRTMVPTLALFSVYLLVIGHDLPGGGFAGGLVAGMALLVMYLAFGERGVRRVVAIDPDRITGLGLALAVAAGLIGLVVEGSFLAASTVSFSAPWIGDIKISTLLVFDLGVYLLVIGLVATAIIHLGRDES